MRTRATLFLCIPWPLRGPVNSTCVKARGGGLHEAPPCDLHSGFLVCLQRCAFLPKDKYFFRCTVNLNILKYFSFVFDRGIKRQIVLMILFSYKFSLFYSLQCDLPQGDLNILFMQKMMIYIIFIFLQYNFLIRKIQFIL